MRRVDAAHGLDAQIRATDLGLASSKRECSGVAIIAGHTVLPPIRWAA